MPLAVSSRAVEFYHSQPRPAVPIPVKIRSSYRFAPILYSAFARETLELAVGTCQVGLAWHLMVGVIAIDMRSCIRVVALLYNHGPDRTTRARNPIQCVALFISFNACPASPAYRTTRISDMKGALWGSAAATGEKSGAYSRVLLDHKKTRAILRRARARRLDLVR